LSGGRRARATAGRRAARALAAPLPPRLLAALAAGERLATALTAAPPLLAVDPFSSFAVPPAGPAAAAAAAAERAAPASPAERIRLPAGGRRRTSPSPVPEAGAGRGAGASRPAAGELRAAAAVLASQVTAVLEGAREELGRAATAASTAGASPAAGRTSAGSGREVRRGAGPSPSTGRGPEHTPSSVAPRGSEPLRPTPLAELTRALLARGAAKRGSKGARRRPLPGTAARPVASDSPGSPLVAGGSARASLSRVASGAAAAAGPSRSAPLPAISSLADLTGAAPAWRRPSSPAAATTAGRRSNAPPLPLALPGSFSAGEAPPGATTDEPSTAPLRWPLSGAAFAALDPDELASAVNRVLAEQARRHGVDLS
jgi:hypothetical protein